MNINRVQNLRSCLEKISTHPNSLNIPISNVDVTRICEEIILICEDIEKNNPAICHNLLAYKQFLFIQQINTYTTINPYACGQVLGCLDCLIGEYLTNPLNEWSYIHPLISKSSKKLYLDGNFANAATDAFIEINARIKKIYMILKPEEENIPDGVELMNKIFADKNPIIDIGDRSTETGRNIHMGTRFMLAGAISALRNPKSHSNEEKLTSEESMRRLMFASMLMYKIDDIVTATGIKE